ncbi:MAG: histidine--tRNA ligase [Oscillospiraceae bacterium]|nr:histidine--tRNA ligase [Oscillospiraceae bacterium]MDY3064385.1 histidine--tRNA ligase [Oscillospiraceae bacterium]
MAITAPRGTQDVVPSDSYKWQFVERTALEVAALFGFREIRTPTFEQMELFQRGVGDTTDVVQKEMFEVKGQKGKDVFALKPEGTAGAVRAALENGLLNDALPLKACYITPCFRHERPQAGRLREFHQFGCEVFGAKSPAADVELISLVDHILKLFGVKGIELSLNSIGCKTCRAEYHKALKAYFEQYKGELCETCLERLDKNPMRILDCKSPECKKIAENAPVVTDYLCDECETHFTAVKRGLAKLGIAYTVDPKIVRGLDYYTKTVFEFVSNDIGAQGTVIGGGRYDGLVEELGGKPTPALGFGMGIERFLLLLSAQGIELPKPASCDLYIGSIGAPAGEKAMLLADRLRTEGFSVQFDVMERSVKAQMKYANKLGAKMSMILGDNELVTGKANVKDMATGEQKEIAFETELVNVLYDAALASEADALAGELGEDAFRRIMQMGKTE